MYSEAARAEDITIGHDTYCNVMSPFGCTEKSGIATWLKVRTTCCSASAKLLSASYNRTYTNSGSQIRQGYFGRYVPTWKLSSMRVNQHPHMLPQQKSRIILGSRVTPGSAKGSGETAARRPHP